MTEPVEGRDGPYPAAPVALPGRRVEPGWIDYNGHMNVMWYTHAFDVALDAFLQDWLGIGPAHVARTGQGPYALQAQYHYLAELRLGEGFVPEVRLLDADAKRLHVYCELLAGGGGAAASLEQVIVNVDLGLRRAVPYPDWAAARIGAMKAAHAGLPRPARAGAPIGLRRR